MAEASEIHGAIFGQYYARLSPAEPDRIYFDRTTCEPDGQIEVTQPDGRFCLRFVNADRIVCFLGAPDAPIDAYVRCFETRPTDARGPSESPLIVTYPNGMLCASVEYIVDGRHYFSCPLTLVKQAEAAS